MRALRANVRARRRLTVVLDARASADSPRRTLAPLAAVLVAGCVAWWVGDVVIALPLSAVLGFAVFHGVRRLDDGGRQEDVELATEALPFALDLLGAALRAGLPAERGPAVVAAAVTGPLGRRLAQVGRALAGGAVPHQAWSAGLGDLPAAAPLLRAIARCDHSGAALRRVCDRTATQLRAARADAGQVAAQRAGVWVVAPLVTCFLPAFVLVGIVPIVAGVLGDALANATR